MRTLLDHAEHILVGGHRGCVCEYPENSISAMEEGVKRGASYLEIDVQLTRDGIPVVFHDVRLEESTSLTGYVHEMTCRQMKEAVEGLCTLEEAMEWGAKSGAKFGLELKATPMETQEHNLALTKKIAEVLEKTDMTEHVFVFGADYQVLKQMRRECKEVMIGLIVPFVPADPVALMKEMDAMIYLSYIYNMTPEIIRQLQGAGYYISGAILRDEHWIQCAKEWKVNMFESDYPELWAIR